jgi:virginiamycin B lyase
LWFTNSGGGSIGRITVGGAVSAFADPRLAAPAAIAPGPDGALWFTDFDLVVRITS